MQLLRAGAGAPSTAAAAVADAEGPGVECLQQLHRGLHLGGVKRSSAGTHARPAARGGRPRRPAPFAPWSAGRTCHAASPRCGPAAAAARGVDPHRNQRQSSPWGGKPMRPQPPVHTTPPTHHVDGQRLQLALAGAPAAQKGHDRVAHEVGVALLAWGGGGGHGGAATGGGQCQASSSPLRDPRHPPVCAALTREAVCCGPEDLVEALVRQGLPVQPARAVGGVAHGAWAARVARRRARCLLAHHPHPC